jgi:hypothetical protein
VVTAVILVIVAFVGNVQLNVDSFYTFIKYLIPSLLFVGIMLDLLIQVMIDALEYFYKPMRKMVILAIVI